MRLLVISSSASKISIGRQAAAELANIGRRLGSTVSIRHLRDLPPVWIPKDFASSLPESYAELRQRVIECDGLILVVPIYSFNVASSGKFLTEALGSAIANKPLMIVASSSTPRSYLAIQSFVFGLIADYQVRFFPHFVFVGEGGGATAPGTIAAESIRLQAALEGFLHFTQALALKKESGPKVDRPIRPQLPLEHFLSHQVPPSDVLSMIENLGRIAPTLLPDIRRLGNTPLMELPSPRAGARIFGKCEWSNPYGSVKDRPAFALIARLMWEEPDLWHSGARIVEYSGGNLAVSLAHIAHHLRIPLTVYLSAKSSLDTIEHIRSKGAEVTLVEPGGGFYRVMTKTFERAKEDPKTRLLYQHINEINPLMHERTTGKEIVTELAPKLSPTACIHWLASVGTGGTLAGVDRALRTAFRSVKTYVLSPAELAYGSTEAPNDLPKLAGSGGFGDGYVQPFIHAMEQRPAGYPVVPYPDAINAAAFLFSETGEMVSSSGAAAWLTAFRVAAEVSADDIIVTVLPSRPTAGEMTLIEQARTKGNVDIISRSDLRPPVTDLSRSA